MIMNDYLASPGDGGQASDQGKHRPVYRRRGLHRVILPGQRPCYQLKTARERAKFGRGGLVYRHERMTCLH